MFNSNVSNGGGTIAATPSLMGLLSSQQNSDQMTQANQARQLAFDTANDPQKLQNQALQNQGLAAELPGKVGVSQQQAATGDIDQATKTSKIQDIIGKNDEAAMQRHVTDAANAGTQMSQLAEEAQNNPLGAKERVKADLAKTGHDDMYNPDWDNLPPDQFAAALRQQGQSLQDTSASFRQEMAKVKQQGANSLEVENARAESQQKIAAARNQTLQAVQATKERMVRENPRGLGQFAATLRFKATQTDDPVLQQGLLNQAADAEKSMQAIAAAPATTTTGVKPNMPSLGIQDNNGARATSTPIIKGAQPQTPAPGTVMDGHKFKGGDPSDKANWDPV